MTIGIDASRANAEHRTGTEWYSYHVIEHLKTLIPEEHTVILYSKEPLRDGLENLPKNWRSRVLNWPPQFLWTQLRLSLEMLFNRPDMLYVPAHTIPLVHPKKVVTVIHDVGFERQTELYGQKAIGGKKPFAKKLMNLLVRITTLGKYGATELDYHRFSVRLALKSAAAIITVSEFSKKEMHELYGKDIPEIHVIHNGLNERPQTHASMSALEKFNITKPYLYFLGRIEQKKNIPQLIDAYALLREKYYFTGQLVLAGSPGYKYEEVQERIEHHNLREHVIETGWVSEEDAEALLEEAELFVFPSLYEGFGIPVLEAMRAGTPVVCSNIPPLKEVGGDACQYFDPRNPESIAEHIHTVLEDTKLHQELQARGKERIKQFSWSTTAKQTWEVLNNIIDTEK